MNKSIQEILSDSRQSIFVQLQKCGRWLCGAVLMISFSMNAQVIPTCGSSSITLMANTSGNLINPTYSMNPGGITSSSPVFTTNISTTFTLYTTGLNSQNTIVTNTVVYTVTITPAPLLFLSATQATCGGTQAVVSATPAGSAANPSSLTWSPYPFSLNSQSTVATYQAPTGPVPLAISVTVVDPVGCVLTETINVDPAPALPVVVIYNSTGSGSITCAHPSVNLLAITNYSNGLLNYFWSSPSATFATYSAAINAPANYTVTVTDPNSQCSTTKTIAIGVNTVLPSSNISPTFQNINCTPSSVTNLTVVSNPTINISHNFLTPYGGTLTLNSFSATYAPLGPGTYTHVLVNHVNGCKVTKGFTITSAQGFPTFSVTSNQSFSLGCQSKSMTVINYVNGNTTPPGGSVSYSLLAPGGGTGSYSVTTPGTYTAIVKDNVSFCETRVAFSVLSNTFGPVLDSLILSRQVLDCITPFADIEALSSTPNVAFNWSFAGSTPPVSGNTIHVLANSAAVTSTLVHNYTLTLTDNNNACKSQTVFPILQNLFPPKALVAGMSSLTCLTPTMMLTNQSISSIPSIFPNSLPVIASQWSGPTPQVTVYNISAYTASTPGTYTMYARDLNNGCTSMTTAVVADARVYPVVNNPVEPPPVCLDGPLVAIKPIITSATGNLIYSWLSPTNATVTGANTGTLVTNAYGTYTVVVTDTLTGCSSAGYLYVINCTGVALSEQNRTGTIKVFPNPGNGLYAVDTDLQIKKVEVYNLTGSLISTVFADTYSSIDLRDKPAGIYFLKFTLEETTFIHKIIKQ
jgi:hypothetical protein